MQDQSRGGGPTSFIPGLGMVPLLALAHGQPAAPQGSLFLHHSHTWELQFEINGFYNDLPLGGLAFCEESLSSRNF
jgi:hypothetical protein